MSTELLNTLLVELESMGDDIPVGTEYLHMLEDQTDVLELVEQITDLANGLIIGENGNVNHAAISQIRYRVGPGEKDSHGWLSGVIYTRVGKVVFG